MHAVSIVGFVTVVCLCSYAIGAALPSGPLIATLAQNAFMGLDGDNDGVMTSSEWGVFKTLVDFDHDGCMSFSEFRIGSGLTSDIATAIYSFVDKSKTGCISMKQLDREFDLMDNDGNGQVTAAEFKGYMVKMFAQIEMLQTVG